MRSAGFAVVAYDVDGELPNRDDVTFEQVDAAATAFKNADAGRRASAPPPPAPPARAMMRMSFGQPSARRGTLAPTSRGAARYRPSSFKPNPPQLFGRSASAGYPS
jgi:hypothetical protein